MKTSHCMVLRCILYLEIGPVNVSSVSSALGGATVVKELGKSRHPKRRRTAVSVDAGARAAVS